MTTEKIRMTPRDFFLHLAVMVGLYVSAISLLALLFQIIDLNFRDVLDYYVDPYAGGIRWAIASLIIVFPLFLFLSRFLLRDYARTPEKLDLGIRKWLMYLTLFVAGAAIIVDLITLINTFLGGEITVRFILKVVSVLLVTTVAFGYYLSDLREGLTLKVSTRTRFAWGSALLVLLSIVTGFVIMGSPQSVRLLRFDEQKMWHLQNIQSQVVSYWQQKQKLPTALSELTDPLVGFTVPMDPQSGREYGYEILSPLAFRLCADFNRASSGKDGKGSFPARPYIGGGFENESWQHSAGNACFDRTIDPEKFPPLKGGRPVPVD